MKPLIITEGFLDMPTMRRLWSDVMGYQSHGYYTDFECIELCEGDWQLSTAQFGAALIHESLKESPRSLLLIGKRVCAAFGVDFAPFTHGAFSTAHRLSPFAILPHPAAHVSYWQARGAYDRARTALVRARVLKEYPPNGQKEKGESR